MFFIAHSTGFLFQSSDEMLMDILFKTSKETIIYIKIQSTKFEHTI